MAPKKKAVNKADLPPGVPHPEHWPHRPIFVYADPANNFHVKGLEPDQPCPIGEIFEFESDIFIGKGLIRVRGLSSSSDPEKDAAYFNEKKRKSQFIMQGKFKKECDCLDIVCGAEMKKPLKRKLPAFLNKIIMAVLRRVSPGVKCDFSSNEPYVLTTFAQSAQTVCISRSGEEPDIRETLKENGTGFASSKENRRKLGASSSYKIDTEHIYTFERYDDLIDFITLQANLKVMTADVAHEINGQPFPIMAKTLSTGEHLWCLQIYHERIVADEIEA